MTSRSSRRSWTHGAVLAVAGALATSLLPASAASASAPPVFSYVGTSGAAAAPNRTLAVADVLGAGPHALTPAGYQVYGYDVAPDGDIALVAARTGTPTTDAYDSTFGLVLLRRDPGTQAVSSILLSVFWDANPVLAGNGTKAFWFYHGTLYEYDAAAGGLQPAITAFAPAAGETVARLAISSDGSRAAVMYTDATARTARVLAAPVATGRSAGSYAEIGYGPGGTQPSNSTFVWDGADTLVWAEYDSAVAGAPTNGVSVTLPTDGSTVRTVTPRPTLNGFYDLRQDASGTWWTWKDDTSVTPAATSAYSLADPLVDTPIPVGAPRTDGATTYRYAPSTNLPPALQPVVNPAAAHPSLALSAAVVAYGRKVAYSAYNYYGGLPGLSYAASRAAEVDRGYLQRSIDGVHWSTAAATSGAHPVIIGSRYYNAYYAKALTRNTWFRWLFPGDAFTKRGMSATRLVKVVPVVSARVAVSGRSRIVYGAASRVGGAVVLYRKVGTRMVKVGVAAISAKGAYSFGKRLLPRGAYRLVTVADRYWASGYKVLRF